ncbi:MAG: histidine--tRNA ligase [Gammaproteobacteria bacterium]|nr:histidine--tRNA ligase [Gammaproteobacteria bacterium]MBV9726763.1 histidine--tRNA ligase [Gammaproteobacteria bacterium]
MGEQIQPVRGMNDVLPEAIGAWQYFERVTRELLTAYGYEEIRVPLLEHTELFQRAIGEHTDVVGKEMYTFIDRGGDSLTLRPEATAGIVRALISNGMLRGQRHKLWCLGPMFRHEAPQAGRYRQFWQVDVEAVGSPGPDVDAELIAMSARLWQRLGIEGLTLQLNSLGTPESRRLYRARLVEYLEAHASQLDADSRRRLVGNPLRVLDSKNPEMQELISRAPRLTEHLDPESQAHFEQLCAMLRALGVRYEINPRLVRGLDYYNRTVFEWITASTAAQNAVCSGGRYDGLIAQLGGDATPAVGFAMGVERLVTLLVAAGRVPAAPRPDVYVVVGAPQAFQPALQLTERLRTERPEVRFELNAGGGNLKAQFRRADRSGALLALILGEDEVARAVVGLKPLRDTAGQIECPMAQLPAGLDTALAAARAAAAKP